MVFSFFLFVPLSVRPWDLVVGRRELRYHDVTFGPNVDVLQSIKVIFYLRNKALFFDFLWTLFIPFTHKLRYDHTAYLISIGGTSLQNQIITYLKENRNLTALLGIFHWYQTHPIGYLGLLKRFCSFSCPSFGRFRELPASWWLIARNRQVKMSMSGWMDNWFVRRVFFYELR